MSKRAHTWLAYDGQGAWTSDTAFAAEMERDEDLRSWLVGVLEFEPVEGSETDGQWDLITVCRMGLYIKSVNHTNKMLEDIGDDFKNYDLHILVEDAPLRLLRKAASKIGTHSQLKSIQVL